VIRTGLSALCVSAGLDVVATCADPAALEAALRERRPAAMITEVRMPARIVPDGNGGAPAEAELDRPNLGVVVIAADPEPQHARQFMASGAGGRAYLLRDAIASAERLSETIAAVRAGGSVIDPPILDLLVSGWTTTGPSLLHTLTPREREILAQIAEAKTNGAIARSLILTKRAVEKHVNSIFAKLDLHEVPDVSPRVRATLLYLHGVNGEHRDEALVR
jgi:DNA-binding NarL/FixJ family response regulator